MLSLLLLAACTNVEPHPWRGGGTHYANGTAASFSAEDTGGGDDTGGGGGDGNAPELLTGSAQYTAPNEAEQVFIAVGVAYTDDPDDVVGGDLYYTLYANDVAQDQSSRRIVDENPDEATQAWLDSNGNITFQMGPVDTSQTHYVEFFVVDFTRNESNTITIDVTE